MIDILKMFFTLGRIRPIILVILKVIHYQYQLYTYLHTIIFQCDGSDICDIITDEEYLRHHYWYLFLNLI